MITSTHDHLKDSTIALSNPFEDADPRVNGFTASKINLLQTRLDKQLGPEYLSTRPGAGGTKVHYIAAEKVISLANDVFGFNGWSSQLQRIDVDFVRHSPKYFQNATADISVRLTKRGIVNSHWEFQSLCG